jgi:hypothetical protein
MLRSRRLRGRLRHVDHIQKGDTFMRPTSHSRQLASRIAAIIAIPLIIAAVGCSARQHVVERDDASITTDVEARLAADTQAHPLAVTVATTAGEVRLTGSVPTDSDRTAVERIAREAPGVRTVDNDVTFGTSPLSGGSITR